MRNNLLFLIVFAHLSCSLDYEGALLDEELSGKTPNTVIINFSETVVKKGSTAYLIQGEKAETFDKKNLTVFTALYFAEYGNDNLIATEGEAEKASFYSDTENIEFNNSFRIDSREQGYYIEGSAAFWDGKARSLSAGGKDNEKEIEIGKDDGSFIRGKGFKSSASDKSFSFESGAEGRFVSIEDDEDDEEEIDE
ncbi:MAG: LPS export ABC transporter periplasmic protein LptC [Spirochaetia bacterium]|jgi:LPS export ABC transporter protein LptC|nr:LPS export ABC transporter periplasmic protein LptC [Spirochaetia bacterium]